MMYVPHVKIFLTYVHQFDAGTSATRRNSLLGQVFSGDNIYADAFLSFENRNVIAFRP